MTGALAPKLVAWAALLVGGWLARAWWRRTVGGALNPWSWFWALSWRAKLVLFALAPMWTASFALGALLFGATVSDLMAAALVRRVPAPLAKVVTALNPSARPPSPSKR